MTWALFLAAFSMGLFGSPHCLGMCGGIVTAFGLSMQHVSDSKKNGLILTYHLGRLISYALLGLIASLVGVAIFQSIMSNSAPRIVLGAVLVLIGLAMLGLPLFNELEKFGMRFWQSLAPLRKKVFPIDSFGKALFAGLLWGFLPCGLVYGALMMAIAGNNIATGAALMFVFGLGTMPMLIATQKTVGMLQSSIKNFRLRQINGVIMMLSGLAVIFIPMMMHHNHNHGSHNQGSHSHSMNETSMHHDMSTMNHSASSPASVTASTTMPTTMPMNHNMSHNIKHDMHNMQDMDKHHEVAMPASTSHNH
ncbi:sulfite exporter TauE/SafE family protein [Moraxella osloensis]|uniref:Sulfite exporter TauE/SafE family protein n=1 Tax=Faucicola osloensis TaxID=34062 RepID=A0AAD0AEU6_FAUOS|nr:sulfite exporter TauE/SafE family protein [Moraxella osloensis]ATQ83488.1 sulfite exporter TauE/SafE family protein [Moraxella osloensis]ATW85982.1 sulfite exporter TauE/SafE family protein [Moraxella osloensis]